jgi:hypothetical protein
MSRPVPYLLLILGLFASGYLRADPVSGNVIDGVSGSGLPGVTIRVLLSGSSWEVPGPTGSDGAFSFELADGFDSEAMDTSFLNLEFSKDGYHKATRMRSAQTRGHFIVKDLRVRLEPKDEAVSRSVAVQPVNAGESDPTSPRRIFHRSYDLFGPGEDESEISLSSLNQRLPNHLRRGIITHLQQLQLPANVTVDPVPDEVGDGDSIKLRTFARSEDALAIILGEAELTVSNGKEAIELASEYRIIADFPGFQPGSLFLDDRIAKADFRTSRLSRSLSKTWGGTTVFALALYETREAMRQSDPQKRQAGLDRAESFLKAQKSSLTGDDMLNRQIDDLLELIHRERES